MTATTMTTCQGVRGGNNAVWMIMMTTAMTAAMGWTDLVVVIAAAADVRSQSQARTNALLV
jgi:hypothetical protein